MILGEFCQVKNDQRDFYPSLNTGMQQVTCFRRQFWACVPEKHGVLVALSARPCFACALAAFRRVCTLLEGEGCSSSRRQHRDISHLVNIPPGITNCGYRVWEWLWRWACTFVYTCVSLHTHNSRKRILTFLAVMSCVMTW